jgi:hypothetical protein
MPPSLRVTSYDIQHPNHIITLHTLMYMYFNKQIYIPCIPYLEACMDAPVLPPSMEFVTSANPSTGQVVNVGTGVMYGDYYMVYIRATRSIPSVCIPCVPCATHMLDSYFPLQNTYIFYVHEGKVRPVRCRPLLVTRPQACGR